MIPLGKRDKSKEVWKEELFPQLEEHLQTLFEKVVLCENSDWPHHSLYVKSKKVEFFILQGPKQ